MVTNITSVRVHISIIGKLLAAVSFKKMSELFKLEKRTPAQGLGTFSNLFIVDFEKKFVKRLLV